MKRSCNRFFRHIFLAILVLAFSGSAISMAAGQENVGKQLLLQAKNQEQRVATDSAYLSYKKAAAFFKGKPNSAADYMAARLGMAKMLLEMKAYNNVHNQLAQDRLFIIKNFKPVSSEMQQYYLISGELQFQQKDIDKVLVSWHKARQIAEALYGPESMQAADIYAYIGKHHFFLGRLDSSSYYAKRALKNLNRNPEPWKAARASAIYNLVGHHFRAVNPRDPRSTLEPFMYQGEQYPTRIHVFMKYLDSALVAETWTAGKDGGYSGKIYFNMAQAYADIYQIKLMSNSPGRSQAARTAIQYLNRSVEIMAKRNDPEIGVAYTLLADFYNTGEFFDEKKRDHYYLLALQKSLPGYKGTSLSQLPEVRNVQSVNYLMQTFFNITQIYLTQYLENPKDVKSLEKSYQYSLKQIELGQYMDDQIRFFEREGASAPFSVNYHHYGMAVEMAYLLYQKTGNERYKNEAFQVAEKYKSYNLLQSLMNKRLDVYLANRKEQKNEYRNLVNRVTMLDEMKVMADRYAGLANNEGFKGIEARRTQAENELEDFVEKAKKEFPEFYQANIQKNFALSLQDAQQKMAEKEAALSYFLNADLSNQQQAFVFVIRKDRTDFIRIDLPENYETKIDSLVAGITNSDLRVYSKNASSLYRLLVQPIVAKTGPGIKKLVIMPDGYLWQIPFETLLTQPTASNDYRKMPYLFKNYNISYQHSATLGKVFEEQAQRQSQTHSEQILAMAPFADKSLAGNIASGKINLMSGNLEAGTYAKLPYTINLLQDLQQKVKGLFLIDQEATESSFKKNAGRFSIIHLATHAETDFEDPFRSKFLLAKGGEEDGLLHMNELLNMDITPNLAVLSACETGVGRVDAKTEGMTSLSWCFNYLGCPSTLSTLWKVDDRQTSNLLKGFYSYLFSGKTKNEALQQAKLDFINNARTSDEANPFYWSGMVLIGDDGPLTVGPQPMWQQWQFWAGAGIIVVVGLSLLLLSNRGRTNKAKDTSREKKMR